MNEEVFETIEQKYVYIFESLYRQLKCFDYTARLTSEDVAVK